jgi:hypothetical protein
MKAGKFYQQRVLDTLSLPPAPIRREQLCEISLGAEPMDEWAYGEEVDSGDDDGDAADDESIQGEDVNNLGDDDDDFGMNEEVDDETADKLIRNFHNGDYDTEFEDALRSDRTLNLPNTRPTQASYIKPDNWVERNRIGLKKIKIQLQNCIDSVLNCESVHIRLSHNNEWDQQLLMYNEEPIVWHEAILDEYWNKLLDRWNHQEFVSKIEHIEITNAEIPNDHLAALVAIFRDRIATYSYTSLIFDNANLCGEGIKSVSELVDAISGMRYLDLSHNRIDSLDSARFLSRSLKSHTCMNDIRLAHCDLGSNPEILSVILQSDVICINLGSNNIDSLGAVKIAEYLEGDPPIEELCLAYNRLNDDDAILISQALRRNTNLEVLSIHSNNFTSIGVKALLTCVFDGSSLNAISESNHTLGGMVMFLKGNRDCINRLIELGRTEKIIAALQDKESLLKYLANVPVELMPEVFAFIRQNIYHSPHKHLSIVYSTMRWWNMPLLYSYYTLKAAVYAEVTHSLEDSVSIDDICIDIKDRTMVDQAIRSLEDDGKVMRSEDEVYLID